MEGQSAIQPRRRPTIQQLPSSSSSTSSRISSSQSYFDVYPERRNRSSQRLNTSSSLRSQTNGESDGIAPIPLNQQSISFRSPLISCNRQAALRDDVISSSTSNSRLIVSSGSAQITPSSSSSSLRSTKGIAPFDQYTRRGGNSEAKLGQAQLSPNPSTSKILSNASGRYENYKVQDNDAFCLQTDDENMLDHRRGAKDEKEKLSAIRLKSQRSMPNVKTRIRHFSPEVHGLSWLNPSRSSNDRTCHEKSKGDRTANNYSNSTDTVQSRGDLFSNRDDEESDSSLDSVGKEVRNTLRSLMRSTGNSAPQMPQKLANQHYDTASKPLHLKIRSTADRILPSYKSKARRLPSNSQSNNRNDRTPSSDSHSLDSNGEIDEEEAQIQRYLCSKRLTTLIILSQAPYQGRAISLADVGDSNGHPVFVFLGLGAVRYLAGLYDEMASILRLRLICIDRWGQGKTDDIPAIQRGVLEWSGVVKEVADRLGIQRFSILAHSAGAPYAMATTLMHSNRISGPVHLLAPWVSPTVESGYKWLRYVPDSVIKTAQAADWRVQAWKLGLNRPALVDLSKPKEVNETMLLEHQNSPLSNSFLHSSHDVQPSLSAPNSLHFDERSNLSLFSNSSSFTSLSVGTGGESRQSAMPHSSTISSGLNRYLDASESPLLRKTLLQQERLSSQSRARPAIKERSLSDFSNSNAPSKTRITKSASPSPSPKGNRTKSSADLATALLKASHTENLVSGGGSDLLVILGRSSQKPWGFSYTDVKHPVNVWYGDKDERINMTSILWMQREMNICSVKIVKGASHDLMTNVAVMLEALESLATNRNV